MTTPSEGRKLTIDDLRAVERLTRGAREDAEDFELPAPQRAPIVVPPRPAQVTRHGIDAVLGQYAGAAEQNDGADQLPPATSDFDIK
jgi:hypothetical protein